MWQPLKIMTTEIFPFCVYLFLLLFLFSKGVFSNAFATGILEGKATTVELMGIGSTALACLNLMTPFNPMLARFGTRIITFGGSVLMSLGLILAGFSTQVWHLYLTQGVSLRDWVRMHTNVMIPRCFLVAGLHSCT
jgi:hypothetical protein